MLVSASMMALSDDTRVTRVAAFIDDLQATGRYTFTDADMRTALSKSDIALDSALRRLKKRARIVAPRRGFFVIVPTEYRAAGAPPPSWFVDDFMCFLGQSYYVALLSAAGLHGASHQQAMTFQVMTDRPTRSATAGRARFEFHMSAAVDRTPIIDMQTETGSMRVSTPEATAFDLVRFAGACGGWSNVGTVLFELAERMDPEMLRSSADVRKTPEIQRLGFLLDRAGHPRLADALLRALGARRYRPVLLAPEAPAGDEIAVSPWRVIPNVDVELDL
jgi:predicted transcriptional regulator of viral defense system